MGLLTALFGSDHQITRPDFDRSPVLTLRYSGLTLSFRDAPHTAICPLFKTIERLDLYDPSCFEEQEGGHFVEMFYSRSWEHRGRAGKPLGGTDVTARIFYYPDFEKFGKSCFIKSDFEWEMIKFCHCAWGWQNKRATLGDPGDGFVSYPVKREDLTYRIVGESSWCFFASQIRGRPPELQFATPITRDHFLIFDFTLSAYNGIDFYSPETNLKETCFQVVDDFMKNVKIQMSDRAKAEQSVDQAHGSANSHEAS